MPRGLNRGSAPAAWYDDSGPNAAWGRTLDDLRHASTDTEQLLQRIDRVEREHRAAQDEVARLRGQLRDLETLYRHAPVGLCLVDRDLCVVHVNRWLAEMNGCAVPDLVGAHIEAIIPVIAPKVIAAYRRVIVTGRPLENLEVRAIPSRDPDFVHTWHVNHHPVRDEAGDVVGVATAVQDVSALRAARDELLRVQQRLVEAQHVASIGNWEWDLVDDRMWWSPELFRIYGVDPREIPRFDLFFELVHPDDRPHVRRLLDGIFSSGEATGTEFRVVLDDGTERTVLSSAGLERSGEVPVRLFGTVQDITHVRRIGEAHRDGPPERRAGESGKRP